MDSAKQQLLDKLKTANNILVTVSRNPSVDQLASCIGLTLLLNKQGKHAAAVFSGEVPSTLEFLKPEDTIEKNTDSLRDFIIALDKSKADKLRYKVEDNVVRIFITPYKTSISQADLDFSEGDFNVDLVVALGVRKQEELDEAITAHGRILHDAVVASVNIAPDSGLGAINWYDPQASSLSELVTELTQTLGDKLLDTQIATALLTGIVAETDRFSNDKTSSQTMSASAALMNAGANQQLVASKLEENPGSISINGASASGSDTAADGKAPGTDGTIEIKHDEDTPLQDSTALTPNISEDKPDSAKPIPEAGSLPQEPLGLPVEPLSQPTAPPPPPATPSPASNLSPGSRRVTEPPSMGGTLTANSSQERLDPSTDPLGLPSAEPPQLLDHKSDSFGSLPSTPAPAASSLGNVPGATLPQVPLPPGVSPVNINLPASLSTPPPAAATPAQLADDSSRTLTDLEKAVDSPHVDPANLNNARDEVSRALNDSSAPALPSEPIMGLGAQPMGDDLHPADNAAPAAPAPSTPAPPSQVTDPTAPPPVPPPIPFQFGSPQPPTQT